MHTLCSVWSPSSTTRTSGHLRMIPHSSHLYCFTRNTPKQIKPEAYGFRHSLRELRPPIAQMRIEWIPTQIESRIAVSYNAPTPPNLAGRIDYPVAFQPSDWILLSEYIECVKLTHNQVS